MTDPSCFLTKFFGVPPVAGEYFSVPVCIQFDYVTGLCSELGFRDIVHSFIPGFTYNFQCSSVLLTNYVPVFLYSYALGFTSSLFASVLLCRVKKKNVPKILLFVLPSIIWPEEVEDGHGRLVRLQDVLSSLMSGFTVLLTFGMASPPLAAVVVLSMVTQTVELQVIIIYMNLILI